MLLLIDGIQIRDRETLNCLEEHNIEVDPQEYSMYAPNENVQDLSSQYFCRGVRGATTVKSNSAEEILSGTRELLEAIMHANQMDPDDVASAIFTTTRDLDAAFPAAAAREIGWNRVALLSGREIDVPGALERCIRILIHWNTTKKQESIVHVYLGDAKSLRPDLENSN